MQRPVPEVATLDNHLSKTSKMEWTRTSKFLLAFLMTIVLCLLTAHVTGLLGGRKNDKNVTKHADGQSRVIPILFCGEAYGLSALCQTAGIENGECYSLGKDDADIACYGDNRTFTNRSGVVSSYTLDDTRRIIESERLNVTSGERRMPVFVAEEIGYTWVSIEFVATNCRKAEFTWSHSTPDSVFLDSYEFYDYHDGTSAVSYNEELSVDYYDSQYQDYQNTHRTTVWDMYDRTIETDYRAFGAEIAVWPDTTDCVHEMIITQGGLSTDEWAAEVWMDSVDWTPSPVSAISSATPTCTQYSSSYSCYIPVRTSAFHHNTIAILGKSFKWSIGS